MEQQNYYIAIDLKSFYASVECVERGLNPLDTNLVVADVSRTEKTICLAVSPSLKAYGIPGRARLFEVVQRVKEVNKERARKAKQVINVDTEDLPTASYLASELKMHPEYQLGYIAAPPRMALYMEYSSKIYQIYLKYVAPEDIHVYSVDEVFMDVTHYLKTYNMTPRQLATTIVKDVIVSTGITATAGIGTNMYLCKVAMDIVAKHVDADENGARVAFLDEKRYRELLWDHKPLTDFWRVGRGYQKKLAENGMFTMGDVARCCLGDAKDFYNEDLLYKLFGVNAELLIDHAWGYEPTTIDQIKSYKPDTNSISTGQVLQHPYSAEMARIIVQEMTDMLVLDLVEKRLVTNQMVLHVGYDIESLTNPEIAAKYHGEITIDHYGRAVPKHAHGTANLRRYTSSTKEIMDATMDLYDRIINPDLLIRRINVVACRVLSEGQAKEQENFYQMDLFADFGTATPGGELQKEQDEKERRIQEALLSVKKRYGKNAILKGMNLQEGATARDRNRQIGGHKA